MSSNQSITERFQKLIDSGTKILKTRRGPSDYVDWRTPEAIPNFDTVDKEKAKQWETSCLVLLRKVFGEKAITTLRLKNYLPLFHLSSVLSPSKNPC